MSTDEARRELRDWLALDHRKIDGLHHEALDDGALDAAAFAKFRERLLRHIGIEERIVFPAVRQREPGRDAERLAALRVEDGDLTLLLVPTPD